MGTSTDAHCFACGYDAEIMIGGGRANFATFASWPVSCSTCKGLTVANALERPLVCLSCGLHDVKPFEEVAGGSAEDLEWERLRSANSRESELSSPASDALKAMAAALADDSKRQAAISWGDLELSRGRYICPSCGEPQLRFGTEVSGRSPIMWD